METANFAIQLYQSKFIFWNVKANKNFREFNRFFPNMFESLINLAQIQKHFASWSFSSNSVSNFNLLPKETLFESSYTHAKFEEFWSNIRLVFVFYKLSTVWKNWKRILCGPDQVHSAAWHNSGSGRLQTKCARA
jgi:hypothetical protein